MLDFKPLFLFNIILWSTTPLAEYCTFLMHIIFHTWLESSCSWSNQALKLLFQLMWIISHVFWNQNFLLWIVIYSDLYWELAQTDLFQQNVLNFLSVRCCSCKQFHWSHLIYLCRELGKKCCCTDLSQDFWLFLLRSYYKYFKMSFF